jgi:DNA-binding MarR family transcriptional regulator
MDRIEIADKLHSAAIHLLRRLRAEEPVSELSPTRLSALSVVVFAGPVTLSDLAKAEQVRLPTISRMVKDLEHEGLVRRVKVKADARVQQVAATARGRRLLREGRDRRIRRLAADLEGLKEAEWRVLGEAVTILERLTGPRAPR